MTDNSHIKFLRELEADIFNGKPDLEEWCMMYTMLVHLIDDIIDEPKDVERTLEAFSLGRRLWSHPIYLKWRSVLDVVDELANSSFIDAEAWSASPEQWQRCHADVLRHQGYTVFFALIYLECGRGVLRKVTKHFREYSHFKHLKDVDETFTKITPKA